jgi:hypothetical protein
VLDVDRTLEEAFCAAGDLRWPGVSPAADAPVDFGIAVAAAAVEPKWRGPYRGRQAAPPADPANPREQLWLALEHELQEERHASLQQAFRHHPEKPEELPDLSNL